MRPSDLVRQIAVISAVCYMIIGDLVGVGVFGGTPIQDAQNGALAVSSSYLTPATPAFSIWTVIYLGLIGYAIWQALPAQRETDRQRAMGWWVALTAVLNGTWIVTVQFAPLWVTLVAIVLLLAALGVTFHRAVVTRLPRAGILDTLLIDATTGLHLGWVTVATVANAAALLTRSGPRSWESAADVWGVVLLVAVLLIGLGMAWASGWRVAPGLAIAWGLAWLAVARLDGEPHSAAIGVGAIIVAILVGGIPILVAGIRMFRPEHD